MAWFGAVNNCLFLILVLFKLYLEVCGSNDFFVYHLDDTLSEPVKSSIQLLDGTHHLHKRQAEKVTKNQSIEDNRSNQQLSTTGSSVKIMKPPEISNRSPPMEANNSTVVKKVLSKNLGENGAGIRKNYTFTTISPPVVSIPNKNETVVAVETKSNQSDWHEDEISISKFLDEDLEKLNKTLEQHNITQINTDTHEYYNSTFITDSPTLEQYWVDMDNKSNVKINGLLSNSHRRAATIKLSFVFPFYGHLIRNITIATGGFLYTGDYVHSWLAATQYIAPLMANFDTGLSNDSYIKYVDNGTAFTVQWERVSLQDKPNDGEFTFQVTLIDNGDIIFVYKQIPSIIENIADDHHPVKVGLSDAYIIERTIFFVRRKTIYEYHRVNFNKEDIKNSTVIYFNSLPTCLGNKDCHSCFTSDVASFQCHWCPSAGLCSNGFDRNRQNWLLKGCDRKQLVNESQCSQVNQDVNNNDGHHFYYGSNTNYVHDLDHPIENQPHANDSTNGVNANSDNSTHVNSVKRIFKQTDSADNPLQASRISHEVGVLESKDQVNMGVSGILTILFIAAIVVGLGVWVVYAYRNPHTTSGQILIRYRPSQWRWKRGEARYTAATIHM